LERIRFLAVFSVPPAAASSAPLVGAFAPLGLADAACCAGRLRAEEGDCWGVRAVVADLFEDVVVEADWFGGGPAEAVALAREGVRSGLAAARVDSHPAG